MYERDAVDKVRLSLADKDFASVDEFLTSLRASARQYYIPVMREQTARLLKKIIIDRKPSQMLEIGTSLGVSAMTALSHCDGRLTTIDIDEQVVGCAKSFFARYGLLSRCEFIIGDAVSVVGMMDGNRYDLIILDGPKGQYLELYQMLVPLLKKGGIMFIDDVNYPSLIKQKGLDKKKHRTIIKNMQEFIKTINSDTNVKVHAYDVEDGVLVAERK